MLVVLVVCCLMRVALLVVCCVFYNLSFGGRCLLISVWRLLIGDCGLLYYVCCFGGWYSLLIVRWLLSVG